jgi:hypothetical protein
MITPSIWKAPFVVTTTTAGNQIRGQVASVSDGSWDAVWLDLNAAHSGDIDGQILSPGGTPIGGQTTLFTGNEFLFESVAVTRDDRLHVAYTSGDNTYVGHYATNLAVSSVSNIETGALISTHPAITAFADGSLFVSYTLQNSSTDWDIFGNVVNADGTVGPAVTIFNDTDQSDSSRLATLDNGNLVVVFESPFVGSNTNHDVYYQLRDKNGGLIKNTSPVNGAGSANFDKSPDVAALHTGGFVVVWTSGISSDHNIFAAVYDRNGDVVRNSFVVNTQTNNNQEEAHVVAMDDGGFLVTWEDQGGGFIPKAQRFDSSGNHIGHEITLDSVNGERMSAAVLADGRTVVSMDESRTGDYNVFDEILDTRTNVTGHVTGHDLFGDGTGDTLILRNTPAGTPGGLLTLVNLSATGTLTQIGQIGADYSVAGSGDFNKDGRSDILMQHDNASSRDLFSLTMNSTQVNAITKLGSVGLDWQIDGTGDFNGDGVKDILMERLFNGSKQFEILGVQNNAVTSITIAGMVPQDYQVDGIGDFNKDGIDDILIHHDSAGAHQLQVLFQGNYTTQSIGNAGSVGTEWNIAGVGDFNGDGYADILGHYDNATQRILSEIVNPGASGNFTVKTLGPVGKNIQIDGIGDLTGDGTADISAHYDSSGTLRTDLYYEMHNSTVTGIVTTGVVGHEWIVS